MKNLIAISLALAMILTACHARPPAAPAVSSTPATTSDFWPAYLRVLQGQTPDTACHPITLHDLMLPCDLPNKGRPK